MKKSQQNFSQTLLSLHSFLHEAEGVKLIMRHSWLSNGRQESVAEHTWRMALMAIILAPEMEQNLDLGRTIKMIIVHDLAEAKVGDQPAFLKQSVDKKAVEQAALQEMVAKLPKNTADELLSLWKEYAANETYEAQFAVALDKLEVVLQHNEADIKTWTETEWAFNLSHGTDKVAFSQLLTEFRALIRVESEDKIKHSQKHDHK